MADWRQRRFVLPMILLIAGAASVYTGAVLASGSDEAAEPALVPDFDLAGAGAAATSSPSEPASAADLATKPANTDIEPDDEALRILVSIDRRRLWLVDGQDTLLRAPVAIGMGQDFSYNGRKYHFATPRGERTVIGKAKDPLWIPPEWHYFEKAVKMGLDSVVRLEKDSRLILGDSSWLVVREDQVGRINHFGNFAAFTPGTEIVFDGIMFIPPPSTAQRRVPGALGPYKLDMGDGYLIHGTHLYNEESIGEAVSHGCVRMRNEDLIRLYPMVPRGTSVTIF